MDGHHQTISSDQGMLNSKNSKTQGIPPQYPPQNMGSGVVSSTGAQGNNTIATGGGYSTYENPILKGPRPFDLKKGLEYDIEMERFKMQ